MEPAPLVHWSAGSAPVPCDESKEGSICACRLPSSCSKSPLSAKSSNSPAARSSGSPITARHDRMTARGKGLLGRVSFFEMEKEDDILLTAAGGRSQGVGKTGRFLLLRSACRPSPGKRRGAADQRISQTREGVNETAFQRSIHRPPVYGRFLVVPFVPSSLPIHRQE